MAIVMGVPCGVAWWHLGVKSQVVLRWVARPVITPHAGRSVPQTCNDGCRQRRCASSDASSVTKTRSVFHFLTRLDEVLRNRLNTDDKHVRRIAKRIAMLLQSSSLQDRYAMFGVGVLTIQWSCCSLTQVRSCFVPWAYQQIIFRRQYDHNCWDG